MTVNIVVIAILGGGETVRLSCTHKHDHLSFPKPANLFNVKVHCHFGLVC